MGRPRGGGEGGGGGREGGQDVVGRSLPAGPGGGGGSGGASSDPEGNDLHGPCGTVLAGGPGVGPRRRDGAILGQIAEAPLRRAVKPVPALGDGVIPDAPAPKRRSWAWVVVTAPLLMDAEVPAADALASTGSVVASPEYSCW